MGTQKLAAIPKEQCRVSEPGLSESTSKLCGRAVLQHHLLTAARRSTGLHHSSLSGLERSKMPTASSDKYLALYGDKSCNY